MSNIGYNNQLSRCLSKQNLTVPVNIFLFLVWIKMKTIF